MAVVLGAVLLVLSLLAVRTAFVLLRPNLPWSPAPSARLRTMVVLGSGGHTAEMIALLRAMDPARYSPRTYIVAETDSGSSAKAEGLEAAFAQQAGAKGGAGAAAHRVVKIPRSREVGQSFFTSFWTTLWACLHALLVVFRERPQVLLCNGPGTCVPLVGAAVLMRILGLGRCGVVYVESIARVQKLSLTGVILYRARLADAFFVQWEELAKKLPRALYMGRLM